MALWLKYLCYINDKYYYNFLGRCAMSVVKAHFFMLDKVNNLLALCIICVWICATCLSDYIAVIHVCIGYCVFFLENDRVLQVFWLLAVNLPFFLIVLYNRHT